MGDVGEDGCCSVARRYDDADRAWVSEAIRKVEADLNRSADTHLHVFPLPDRPGTSTSTSRTSRSTRPAR